MSLKVQIIQKILFPWQTEFDQKEGSYYYFNPITNESKWKLPENIREQINEFVENMDNHQYLQKYINEQRYNQEQQLKQQQQQQINKEQLFTREKFDQSNINNMERFLTPEMIEQQQQVEEELQTLMKRPARQQIDEMPNKNVAYTQGGLDYNIWFNSHNTDELDKKKSRERAQYRLDPDLDTGYTKADQYDKYSSYFCVHFARGMCCQGENCKYYHRVPTLQECYHIDESRDIFGRPRHATQKQDMGGVGSFMHETRTLMVSEFKCRRDREDDLKTMYEVMWRHFSVYGTIEDINIKPTKAWAFIRFIHRCFAEFCKEAMMNQALDQKEMILVRWAEDDIKNDSEVARKNQEDKARVVNALQKKFNQEQQFKQQQKQ